MNFETIIGIEIHLQLKTKTKMFSPAQNVSNAAPNTHVHPIDMGFPGVLPRVNKKAVEFCLAFSLAIFSAFASTARFFGNKKLRA